MNTRGSRKKKSINKDDGSLDASFNNEEGEVIVVADDLGALQLTTRPKRTPPRTALRHMPKWGTAANHILLEIGCTTPSRHGLLVAYSQFGRTSDDGKSQHPSLTITMPLLDPDNAPLVSATCFRRRQGIHV